MRALYGLKSSGAAWGAHLAYTLHHLGYQFCLAYPDVWCRAASKEDGFPFPYYEYVLVYVDDLLVLSHQGDKMMKALEEFYRLKDGFALPIRYLVVTSCGTIQEVAMVPHMVPIAIGKVLVQSNALSGLQVK
jgi:hypothetical protein